MSRYTQNELHEDIGILVILTLALTPFIAPFALLAYLLGRRHRRP